MYSSMVLQNPGDWALMPRAGPLELHQVLTCGHLEVLVFYEWEFSKCRVEGLALGFNGFGFRV